MATQPSDTSKRTPQRTITDELAIIAQRAQAFTNASGAAIALSEGIQDEIVCKARSGSSSPEVGAVLRVDGSFTGLCIQTGRELRCDDTETDTRVDTLAVRGLGIRSMVITPIRDENRPVGVLAVFASTPHAFTITHVAVLKTMADQISGLLLKDRRAREEGLHPEPPPVNIGRIPSTPSPGPVAVRSIAAAIAPPIQMPIRPPAPRVESRVEPIRPMAIAAEVGTPIVTPKREELRPEPKQEPVLRAGFGTLDAMSSSESKSGASKALIFGVLALVLAGAAGTWYFVRARRAQNTAKISTPTLTVAPANPVDPNAPPTNSQAQAENGGTNSAPSTTGAPGQAAVSVSQPPAKAAQPAASDKVEIRKIAQEKPSPVQQTPVQPAPIAISGGPSKIAASMQQQQQSPDVAPSIAVGGNSSSGLSALSTVSHAPTAAAPAARLVQSQLVDVKLIKSTPPVYPQIARTRRLTGLVKVKVKVSADGRVISAEFYSGPAIFKDAALDAVRQWRYQPATLDGKPIEQETEITLKFSPGS
jgi:TonB family protein